MWPDDFPNDQNDDDKPVSVESRFLPPGCLHHRLDCAGRQLRRRYEPDGQWSSSSFLRAFIGSCRAAGAATKAGTCQFGRTAASERRCRANRPFPFAELRDRFLGECRVYDVVVAWRLAFLDVADLGHQLSGEVHALGAEAAIGIPDALLDQKVETFGQYFFRIAGLLDKDRNDLGPVGIHDRGWPRYWP